MKGTQNELRSGRQGLLLPEAAKRRWAVNILTSLRGSEVVFRIHKESGFHIEWSPMESMGQGRGFSF
ncbi:MAG TPA: hypothetical protein VER98_19200 [Terriglobia bacterium]|nr:hypothetical protein [Terriglobia bacterium]